MQANKKYELNGTQYCMYPNPVMNITQTINGAYSHRGTNAIDDAQADNGRSNGYAPCDMVCVATDYGDAYGNAMFWQSQNPVITRSHGTQYIHMMVIHDSTANAYVGMKISQGQQLFTEGVAGNATGNHNHIEVALGKFGGTHYVASGYKTSWNTTVYMMPNNINPAEVFFVDDTNIVDGGGLNWGTIPTQSSSGLSYDDMEDETWAVRFKNDTPITIHKNSTTGESFGTFVNGETQAYSKKGAWNGHRWIGYKATVNGKEYKCVCAISGSEKRGEDMWVELIDPSTIGGSTQTQTTEQPKQEEQKQETTEEKKEETKVDYTKNVKGYGVDLSEHNGDVDVSQYDFAIIRCTWGCADSVDDKSQVDSKFDYWVSECEKHNVPYGVYCYDYALSDSDAVDEANYLLAQIKDKNIQLGVWFDMEDADGYKKKKGVLTKDRCSGSVKRFCDVVKAKGYFVGVYCSSSWIGTYVETEYPLWIANWGTNDGTVQSDQSDKGVLHQYTSTPLDKNVMYKEISYFASNPIKEEEKQEEKKEETKTEDTTTTEDKKQDIETTSEQTLIALLIKLVKKILSLLKNV